MSNLCDGSTYIVNLSNFIKNHESQLANGVPRSSPISASPSNGASQKPVRLLLTLHHLYFLLDSFSQTGLKTGPLSVRLHEHDRAVRVEPPEHQEYVSFLLNNYQNTRLRRLSGYLSSLNSDSASVTSISSVRSALSSLWTSIAGGASVDSSSVADNPALVNHLRYLYTSFQRLPCIRLSPDASLRLIRNYQEFPFDTAVPLMVFRNLSILELSATDPCAVLGWNLLATRLRMLVVRNVDMEGRIALLLEDLPWHDNQTGQKQGPGHHYTSSLPNLLPNLPIGAGFDKKKLSKKRHKSFANIRRKKNDKVHETKPPDLLLKALFLADKWKTLKYLSLTNANLTSLEEEDLLCFGLLENVVSLDLSHNRLKSVGTALRLLRNLKSLNLSENLIGDLQGFRKLADKDGEFLLPQLSLVTLRHNELTSLDGVECLLLLSKLDVGHNHIHFLRDLKSLFLSGVLLISKHEDLIVHPNPNRAPLLSISLAGNPVQNFDKNYRLKLFNLARLLGWTSLKINGLPPSYLELYYLMEEAEDPFNGNSQLFLNFKKYLLELGEYFHQLKLGSAPAPAAGEGLFKSISNYSMHIFAKDAPKSEVLSPESDKENGSVSTRSTIMYDDEFVEAISKLDLDGEKKGKTFPKTVETNPIAVDSVPVNIQGNKLYYRNGHGHSSSISSIDNFQARIVHKSEPKPIATERTVLNGMATSKSLNNLLNLSHGINVESSKGSNIRTNTVFDHTIPSKHERTKSAISYQSTQTLTE